MEDLDRVPGLGAAPDRVVVTAERHRAVPDAAHAAEVVTRTASSTQETGVLIEPEAALLKELSRLRVSWAYFSTLNVFEAAGHEAAEAELARLTSATLAANKLGLRVALLGPTGRHLPPALAALPHVEEIYPTPDLWAWALRSGWEKATAEYIRLLG
jgi:pyridoxine 5'-phosphate synthase PdxJ